MSVMSVSGSRIKELRKKQNLSAEELAEKVGVSPATIYRYESSDIRNMGSDKLWPIASALQTTTDYLLGQIDDYRTSTSSTKALSSDEATILDNYRHINDDMKKGLLHYSGYLRSLMGD